MEDDEEMIKRMKVPTGEYLNLIAAIEALITDDTVALAAMKSKCLAVKAYNDRIGNEFRSGDESVKEQMVRTYTLPEINDAFIAKELG